MPRNTPMTMLKQDHQKVKELLMELAEVGERATTRRSSLRQEIYQEILIHKKLEEEIFYPAFRTACKKRDDERLFHEAVEEHHAADLVLQDLMKADPAKPAFAGKAKVLKELIEHHIREEEEDMFPLAKRLIPADQLEGLAEQMMERKTALTSKMQASARKQNNRVSRGASPN